jgi:hypothetical protein
VQQPVRVRNDASTSTFFFLFLRSAEGGGVPHLKTLSFDPNRPGIDQPSLQQLHWLHCSRKQVTPEVGDGPAGARQLGVGVP